MAYTSVIPVYRLDNAVRYAQDKQKTTRQHGMPLAETVDYALNREKTETDGFESGLGCTTQSAYEDMRANAVRWHKTDGVQGYHLVQSFAEGEVTPELAHKIGLELAERVLGGRYQAIVTTHLNTSHYHNHIVWSSVAMNSGRKYHSNAKSYALEIRAVSDELCVKYGLSIIQTERAAQVSKPYAEWLAEKNGQPTWRTVIRQDVDAALAEALTWRQFIRELESKGYELNFNHKYPTLRPPGKTRPVRFKTLGRQYTSEALQIRILYPDARWHFLQEQPPVAKHARLRKSYGKARRLTGLRALYYRYLYELGALPHKPRRPSYAVRQDIRNLDRRIRQMEFLSANSIDSIEQLQAKQIALENKIAELQTERQRLYRTAPNSPEIPAITAALKPLRRDLMYHVQRVHPFTAPFVKPASRYVCPKRKTRIEGSNIHRLAAIARPSCFVSRLAGSVKKRDSGQYCGDSKKVIGCSMAFQASKNPSVRADIRPGIPNGIPMRQKRCH